MLHPLLVLASLSPILSLVHSQALGTPPHDYPGKPSGGFSPAWQQCASRQKVHPLSFPLTQGYHRLDYQVTQKLPNATFDLGRNWAGNIPVNRPNHPNDTLFFWAFEKENGSLTANAGERSDEPWGVWLNGGYVLGYHLILALAHLICYKRPGSSSMVGLLFEVSALHILESTELCG